MIMELVMDLVSEIFMGALHSNKTPRLLRMILLTLLCFFFILVSAAVATMAFRSGNIIGVIVSAAIGFVLTLCWILGLRCYIKTRRTKCQQKL